MIQNGHMPGGIVKADPDAVTNALLLATQQAAAKSAGEQASAQEGKDWAQAALYLAQAVVVLDPGLSQGGTPLEHDIAMEGEKRKTAVAVEKTKGELAIRQAKEAAAAPTPVKRISSKSDGKGGREYTVSRG